MDSRLYGPAPWVATDRNQFKRCEALGHGYLVAFKITVWSKVVGSQTTCRRG
jgi:hypothetical protein